MNLVTSQVHLMGFLIPLNQVLLCVIKNQIAGGNPYTDTLNFYSDDFDGRNL